MRAVLIAMLAVALYALEVGEPLPGVVLDGKIGKKVDGKPFKSQDLRGKIWLLIYSDPDKKSLNEEFFEKVKAKHFDRSRYGSVAIVNMAATWMPNFAISAILRSKQKRYPDTIYVKDCKKYLVQRWGLKDDDMNIVLLDKDLRVLFIAHGKMSKEQQRRALQILERKVNGD